MANLGTLTLGTYTNVASTTKTGADPVLESIAAFNDGSYVSDAVNNTHVGAATFTLGNMPVDFRFMETLSIRLRYLAAGAQVNTWDGLLARVFKADGVTPLTNQSEVVAGPITTTTGTNSSVVALTGVDTAATAADWNGAIVLLEWSVLRNKGGDTVQKRVTAAELTGTYTIDTSINLGDDVTLTDEGVALLTTLWPEAFDLVTVSEDRTLVLMGEPALVIALGDYVIIQDGVIDQPKIVILEDVAVAEFLSAGGVLLVTADDDVVVQDSPAVVAPALISMAIVAFDTVVVNEGIEDEPGVLISAIDTITITEFVDLSMTLVRVNVFDVVMLEEAPGVFAGGPVGVVAFDNVLVQEFIHPSVSVYINAFEEVNAADGAREVSAFDDVTVTEDSSVKVANLSVDVFDLVSLTEFVAGEGISLNILGDVTAEDILVAEAVTVLLTSLHVSEVSDDVNLLDDVLVAVSSISINLAVSEDVTVVDVLTAQTTPIFIDEFTEIAVVEFVEARTHLLVINMQDMVTVTEDVFGALLPMFLSTFDEVVVNERVALRIRTGVGTQATSLLPLVGVGR